MTRIVQKPVNACALATEIESHAVAAWPARETQPLDGWLLRFTNGFTHRGNSVATLQFSGADVEAAVDTVESEYRQRRLPPMFQVASAVEPANLSDILSARGYDAITPTFVRMAAPSEIPTRLPEPTDVTAARPPNAEFAALVAEGSRSEADAAERMEILARVRAERACVIAWADGKVVACGTATLTNDHVGINMMRTTLAQRQRGHAQRVLAAIARWAQDRGAARVYLGVEQPNAPAVALYARAGFVPAYSYRHFRQQL